MPGRHDEQAREVLVLDGDGDLAEKIRIISESNGYQVNAANEAQTAVSKPQTGCPFTPQSLDRCTYILNKLTNFIESLGLEVSYCVWTVRGVEMEIF